MYMGQYFNHADQGDLRRRLRNEAPLAEQMLWQYLRRKQLKGYKFKRQFSIDAFVIDFYCPKAKLAIEIDGDSHFGVGAKDYDEKRQKHIEALGVTVIRFRNDEVRGALEHVLENISRHLP